MHRIKKKIVTDENMRPVAVQIDLRDWEKIVDRLDLEENATVVNEPVSTEPDLSEDRDAAFRRALAESAGAHWQGGDGLEYQRRIRAEWTRPWDPEAQEGDESEDA